MNAVTPARAFSDTFAGIRPQDVPGFIVVQAAGAAAATVLFNWLHAPTAENPSHESHHLPQPRLRDLA